MELFNPSKRILEKICSEGEKPVNSWIIYKPFGEGYGVPFFVGIISNILEYYKIDSNKREIKRLSRKKIHASYYEAMKNCFDHGPKKEVISGLFLGSKGVCYGSLDFGDYFKDKGIKNQYENKIKITKFNWRTKDNSRNGVNEYIYPSSDFIQVDSTKGILYLVQLKENIIAPKGEDGDEYFYKKNKN